MDSNFVSKKSPKFLCEVCDYKSFRQSEYDKHLLTAKHQRMTEKISELATKISCEYCDYNTCKMADYNKHLLTAKHQRMTTASINLQKNLQDDYKCECGKIYKYRQGLFRHSKNCNIYMEPATPSYPVNTDLILEIIKENQEFKSLLIEQCKTSELQHEMQQRQLVELQKENNTLMNKMVEITQTQLTIPNTVNNNNTINNNQKFNLNFFLNETCKDAMTIQDFIDNIKITFDDLLTIGNAGFVNGVSDILLRQLNDLDITKRPIHCTDSKRDTIYLKENNEWNKDDKNNNKLKCVLEKVEKKNVVSLHQWCQDNPDSKVNNTDNNLLRDKIFMQTLQGDDKTREKIIKNIAREVLVEK
jgi:hypothetical protein